MVIGIAALLVGLVVALVVYINSRPTVFRVERSGLSARPPTSFSR